MDIEGLNAMPANRKAREMLERVGEAVDCARLHCIQLAVWALDRGRLEIDTDLAETVRAMPAWRPVRLVNFFMISGENAEFDPAGWEAAGDPEGLARVILEEVERKMLIHFPWYGSVY
jgi:hypothetical protein